jgi:hypothetical protein
MRRTNPLISPQLKQVTEKKKEENEDFYNFNPRHLKTGFSPS